ncbi:diphthamide biosynthesis enzyme Dph2 [Candidatus Bathyarchaeota archaeon]|nr:diphthamide biosynthesis enzyme Dph2 [Candidatus Bathyarchaeota archaeon]
MKAFDFEEEKLIAEIIARGANRVLLQLPEGLKSEAPNLAKNIEKTGVLSIISGDPCYGACDLPETEVDRFNIDLVIHFGHSKMVKIEKVPTIYVDVRSTAKITKTIEKSLLLLKEYTKIGLVTTVQHIQTLKTVQALLVKAGKTVFIGNSDQIHYNGQVTGCNYSNVKSIEDKVEVFLFVGGGRFHALGVALSTIKPTILANPFDQKTYLLNTQVNKLLHQHWALIQKAKKAKNFGILVSLKPGQENFKNAMKIKKIIENMGKNAVIILLREIVPEALMEFPTIDAYVNTACPRISFDAPLKFLQPVLSINEFKVLSGECPWQEMIKIGLFEK